MKFMPYTNIIHVFLVCVFIEENLAADDQEVSIATTSERDETKDQQGSTNSTNKPSFRKRNFMWKSKAVSKLQERHENAYEATTYRSKNVRTKPPPVSVDPLATDSEKRKLLNAHLLDLFGRNDTAKKEILDCEDAPNDMYGSCYISNYQTFMKHCYFAFSTSYRYGGLLYVKNLIARACKADWITTDEIKKILLDACSVRQRL